MKFVTIKEVKGVVKCADDGTAEHVFNVKNATDKVLKVGLHLSIDDPTNEAWLKIDGATEHELDVETMTQISVKIQVPADGAPGKYTYRLRVFDPDAPGENYTDGDPVFFDVPDREEKTKVQKVNGKQPFKWWIPAAIAAGVIVIGVVVWLAWPSGIKMPDFTQKEWSQARAEKFLKDNSLEYKIELKKDPNPRSDLEILAQAPEPDTKIKKEEKVILKIAGVTVPQVIRLPLADALRQISSRGLSFDADKDLTFKNTTNKNAHGKVVNQSPRSNSSRLVPKKSHVRLDVGRFASKKFVFKQLPQVKMMPGIKMSPAFIKREVAPAPE